MLLKLFMIQAGNAVQMLPGFGEGLIGQNHAVIEDDCAYGHFVLLYVYVGSCATA
jgi:hypothetical protein